MLNLLARNWWVFALRGGIAVVFGLMVLLFPQIALRTFIILFALYTGADGFFAILSFFERESFRKRGWQIMQGVISVAAAVLAVLYPGMTALIILYVIASRAIVTGALQIAAAIHLRREIEGELWLAISGAVSVIFGSLLVLFPATGALAVLTYISIYAISYGIMLILLAFRLKTVKELQRVPA
jgi:uncharacterized membrane protein HdeD (DUF308 family)